MRLFIILLLLLSLSFSSFSAGPFVKSGAVEFKLTEPNKLMTADLGNGLQLRVAKDSSIRQQHFGWIVEVVKMPYRRHSKNLLFQNSTGSTADLSQVYAWQVGNEEFPRRRKLKVEGYPLYVVIELRYPKVAGKEANSRFTKGNLKISWKWERPYK